MQIKFKNMSSLRELCDNIKLTNICVLVDPAAEESKKVVKKKNVFNEIMAEHLLNLKKETDIQIWEVQRVSNKMNPKRTKPIHIIFKMAKFKITVEY